MEENDSKIVDTGGVLNLLIDSSAYQELNKIADVMGQHPLILIEAYPKIQIFFTSAMINENIRGGVGFNGETQWMFKHSLQDEGSFSGKEAVFLYNHEDGSIQTVKMNNISGVDYGQILLAQNHKNIVLLTNDHGMLKSAGALMGGRIMDVPNLLELMKNMEYTVLQKQWQKIADWYESYGGYTPPKTVNYIDGIIRDPHPLTGEVLKPKPEDVTIVRKKGKSN